MAATLSCLDIDGSCARDRLVAIESLELRDTGCLCGRRTRQHESAHALQASDVGRRVATVGARGVLTRPQAVAAVPRAQGGGGHPEPTGNGRDGEPEAGGGDVLDEARLGGRGRRGCVTGAPGHGPILRLMSHAAS